MATKTATVPKHAIPSDSQQSNNDPVLARFDRAASSLTMFQYARNTHKMTLSRLASEEDEPARTETNPSPDKKIAGPFVHGEPQVRAHMDTAIEYELKDACYRSPDLAEQMFGHIVSTHLARDILCHFSALGVVCVFEGKHRTTRVCLAANSDGAERALDQAVQETTEHGLLRSTADGQSEKPSYSWEWPDFPNRPISEDLLVSFLNTIIDKAFKFAISRLVPPNNQLRYRFAAPTDKHHAIPLAYEADVEDMRPDFFLLPNEAFLSGLNTVDENYINFTTLRAVGESKSKQFSDGINQVHRYLRGVRRAQPWLHFAIAMAIAKDKFCLLRGDSSGVERVQLTLTTGRGCIEFVRVILAVALADPVDLGQNPDVELGSEVRSCRIPDPPRVPSKATTVIVPVHASAPSQVGAPASRSRANRSAKAPRRKLPVFAPTTSQTTTTSVASTSRRSSTSKRNRPEADDDIDAPEAPPKKRKIITVDRLVFFPASIYTYKSLGILFTVRSIRGRCTVVLTVSEPSMPGKLFVLKMSWQDEARLDEQNQVLTRLEKEKPHPNVVVPFKIFRASRKGRDCTTLGAIRGFLDDQLAGFAVENRVLIVSISDLKRPVKYFWGVHDFVRGLCGALLGHEFLVSIGIIHRDFSENNMTLARFPGGIRGYLIDLDMAILQEANQPNETTTESERTSEDELVDYNSETKAATPLQQDTTKPIKGLRTGTTPYMSFNVLRGGKHTHFDDVESFLYVLLLFFFSYSGPLSKAQLQAADSRGFVEPVGTGRLPHMTRWPETYVLWAEGQFTEISARKEASLKRSRADIELVDSKEVQECLKNWHPDLQGPIKSLLGSAWRLFSRSLIVPGAHKDRTEVSHAQFVSLLEKWLKVNAHLEKRFSNCPFEE